MQYTTSGECARKKFHESKQTEECYHILMHTYRDSSGWLVWWMEMHLGHPINFIEQGSELMSPDPPPVDCPT